METPHLPQSIFKDDFEYVYEPAEDTFLLLDALQKDLEHLNRNAFVCLECGSGSGCVITALSKSLEGHRLMLATDINMRACGTTRKCARFHHQDRIQTIRTNLAEPLADRLENFVDLLVFNPPYVPTDSDEIQTGTQKPIYLSWAGGPHGRTITDKFLSIVPKLLSKPYGRAYLVALEHNDINYLQTALLEFSINGTVVIKRIAGSENLSVIKYVWKTS